MWALNVEPYLVKQLARQQKTGCLDKATCPERRAPIEQVFIDGTGIVVNHLGPHIGRSRRDYSIETAHQRRGPTGRESDLSFQLVRQPLIVIVKKRDPFARRMIGAGIACSGSCRRVRIDEEL